MTISFVDLQAQRQRLGGRIDRAIARVIEHGKFIMGPEVKQLEEELASFCGARHSISCSSGTDALLLPLLAWGVGLGDAVFVPAFTFVATAEPAALLGATPVFVDVQPDTFNMDPESLRESIENVLAQGELTPRVVIPVDLFGQPADYETLSRIAREHGLKVLADAAQSFGGSIDGQLCGTFGDATATSFFPAKPLGCYGDGGAVFTNDSKLYENILSIRVHGKGDNKYDNVRIGVNGRLDTIQAAILLKKITILEEEISARNRIAANYTESLAHLIEAPRVPASVRSAWAQYTIRVADRDRLMAELKAAGIPTAVYYPLPLHRQSGYAHFPTAPGGLPVAEELSKDVLSLPIHPYLGDDEQTQIIDALSSKLR